MSSGWREVSTCPVTSGRSHRALFSLIYNRLESVGIDERSRRAVGSLIGIGFLLMIIGIGVSYYNVINRIEDRSRIIIDEMQELDRDAADEFLDIQGVALTVGNSLNLTIKNTGNILSELEWVGVFDDTLNTQDYYRLDVSLNPVETQKDIGNTSIVMNPANLYSI